MKDVARSNDDSAASLPPEDASRKEEKSAAPGAADSQAGPSRLDLPAGDDPDSAEGGLPSLAELIETFHAPLYRYAFRLTGQTADAEDLTQQAFLVAQRKRHQIREAERAGAWLFAVLRSCYLKSKRKNSPTTLGDGSMEDFEAAESSALHVLDREKLQAALLDLPDEFRVVVLMFYFEELSYKEIADQVGIPIGTVMSRLSRAKNHLRSRLDEQSS